MAGLVGWVVEGQGLRARPAELGCLCGCGFSCMCANSRIEASFGLKCLRSARDTSLTALAMSQEDLAEAGMAGTNHY